MRRGLALAAALLLVSGCGVSGIAAGHHFDDVMRDPRATADQIIDAAGPPDEVARTQDGSLLVLWMPFIDPEGSDSELEGATAWRLFDPRGRTVRTYSSPDLKDLTVLAAWRGFLVVEDDRNYHFKQAVVVDTAGAQHRVPVDPRPKPVRAGDVFVPGNEVQRFYRPSDGTLHALLPEPGTPQGVLQWSEALIDERGALWMQGYEGRRHWVAWSRDGGRTLRRQQLPLEQPGGTLSQPRMAVAHGVTAVVSDQVKGDAGGRVGPAYLDVVSGYGRSTQRATAETFAFLDRVSIEPDLSVITGGRVLLGDRDAGQWWVAKDRANTEFERLHVPKDTAYVRDLEGALFAWGEWDHRGATLRTSTDGGRTWDTFDVTPQTG